MTTIDEALAMLDDVYDELPKEFHKDLDGGVILSAEVKIHPASEAEHPLYILGEYHSQPRGLGRFIIIYYGSFTQTFAHLGPKRFKGKLRKTLLHEFTHHLESLAGERDLEIQDARWLAEYNRRKERGK